MLKFEMTAEIWETLRVFGYIAEPHIFKDEESAAREGFYWCDELDRWVDFDRSNDLILDTNE